MLQFNYYTIYIMDYSSDNELDNISESNLSEGIDIEYDSSPQMQTSNGGATLQPHEITAIQTRMGESQSFRKDLRKVMVRANNMKHKFPNGHTAVGFDNIIKYARTQGISSSVLNHKKYKKVFDEIDTAYVKAKRQAVLTLPMEISIGLRQREMEVSRHNRLNEKGDIDTLNKLAYPELKDTLNLVQ